MGALAQRSRDQEHPVTRRGIPVARRRGSLVNAWPFARTSACRDYEAVTLLAISPNALVAHPAVQAANLKDVIALARAKPGQINYASASVASVGHLTGELLNALGFELVGSTPEY